MAAGVEKLDEAMQQHAPYADRNVPVSRRDAQQGQWDTLSLPRRRKHKDAPGLTHAHDLVLLAGSLGGGGLLPGRDEEGDDHELDHNDGHHPCCHVP